VKRPSSPWSRPTTAHSVLTEVRVKRAAAAVVLLYVVTVSAADGVRGLLVQGRRKSTTVAVGQFINVDDPRTSTVDCDEYGLDNTLVAWYGGGGSDDDDDVAESRSFTWMPPDNADGPLQLVYVVVESNR